MNKFRQCMYTILLLITCLVASPLIFRQIWKSSKDVKPASSEKPPVIDLKKKEIEESSEIYESEPTTEALTEEITTEPPPPVPVFVESDSSYFDDALFIGDSRTVGIRDYGTLPNASYFCSVGLASYKIDYEYDENGMTLYDKLSYNTYGKVYIMLGVNELGNDSNYTIESYRTLVENIRQYQPDAIIYILANLHVTQLRETEGDLVNNTAINTVNDAISQLADDNTIFYLDVNEIFDDSTGCLMSECSSDGVHVFAKYYETWCNWLCMNTVPVADSLPVTEEIITTDIPLTEIPSVVENYDYSYSEDFYY